MSNEFEQISIKPGFMKHNGGVLFRTISETEYEFKSTINENHLNAAGITHGGYLSALIDAGAGTSAHRAANGSPCVTISLDLKFIGASKVGDEITGFTKILKKTTTLIFLFCELKCNDKIVVDTLKWNGEAKKSGFEMGDLISEFKIENSNRPNKTMIYPIAILLLFIFGYLNFRRKE